MKWAPLLLLIVLLLPTVAHAQTTTIVLDYNLVGGSVTLTWTKDGTDPYQWYVQTGAAETRAFLPTDARSYTYDLPSPFLDPYEEVTVYAMDETTEIIYGSATVQIYPNGTPTPEPTMVEPTPTSEIPTSEPTMAATVMPTPTNTALAGTQTAVATTLATPTGPTPTAIAAVELQFTDIVSATRLVSSDLVTAWNRDSDTSNLLIAAASIVLGFWVLLFLKVMVTWRRGG